MHLNEYQTRTQETAMYPDGDEGKTYTLLAMCGEVGELANLWKKVLRNGGSDQLTPDEYASLLIRIRDELGDVLWYLARTADEFLIPLEEVGQFNLQKLFERQQSGTVNSLQRPG